MSSGTAAQGGEQVAIAAEEGLGLAAEGDGLGAVEAVGAAGASAAGATIGGAGARALAAMETAAAIAHRRLPAGAAAVTGLCPAARRLQIVAGAIAVSESAPIGNDAVRAAGVG